MRRSRPLTETSLSRWRALLWRVTTRWYELDFLQMEQREGKILRSTLSLGNRAVGARGLAKGEFITKSWCFYPAFFVILTARGRSSLSLSRSFPTVPRRLPRYPLSRIFSHPLPSSVPSRRRWATRKIALFTLLHCRVLRYYFFLLPSVSSTVFSSWLIYPCIRIACTLRVFIFVLASGGGETAKTGWKGGQVKNWEKGKRRFYEGGHYRSPRWFVVDKIEYESSLKISSIFYNGRF